MEHHNHSDIRQLMRYLLPVVIMIVWILFDLLTGGIFFSSRNLANIFIQSTTVGVASLGMALVLICGYFDLSCGAIASVSSAAAAAALSSWGVNTGVAIGTALLIGTVLGLIEGICVAYGKLPALIVTLNSQVIFTGLLHMITGSNTISVDNAVISFLGKGYLPYHLGWIFAMVAMMIFIFFDAKKQSTLRYYGGAARERHKTTTLYVAVAALTTGLVFLMNRYQGVPAPILLLCLLAALLHFLLYSTRSGAYFRAIGESHAAASLFGINNAKTTCCAFSLLGLFCGIAGIVSLGHLGSAIPAGISGLERKAIAACVIGGISLSGGSGNVWGTLLGAIVITSLYNGMSLIQWNTSIQNIIIGLIPILSVLIDYCQKKKPVK